MTEDSRKTVLADHPDYRITLHRHGDVPTDRLIITFGGQPSDISDEGFGTKFCLANDWDTIFVAQRHTTQFQGLSFDAFFDAVAPHVSGRDICAYGSSLGGYAALYYGGTLDARIIAAAPMLPAWPPLRNRAYSDLSLTHAELWEVPRSKYQPVIIYDPMRKDDSRIVGEMVICAYPEAQLVHVPYGGHTVLVTLSHAGLLKPIMLGLLGNDEIIDFAPPAEGTAIWHGERGRHLAQVDPARAAAELRKSLTIRPGRQVFCILVNLMIRQGFLDEAQSLIDQGKASGSNQLSLVPSLIEKARNAGLAV